MAIRKWIGLVLGLTFAYALCRYVVFGDVAWVNVPLYVSNKAISWSGVIFFGMSLLAREKTRRQAYGTVAAAAIGAHLVMSLMVLNPNYFGKFYGPGGRLNGVGELSMLAGVVGLLYLGGLFVKNLTGSTGNGSSLRAGWGRMVLWFAVLHVGIMGYGGWLKPETWPGYLPPITLWSFLMALGFLFLRSRKTGT